ncbi:MAG: 30S ribosomal protein S6 [Patescibacteria group bacterium]
MQYYECVGLIPGNLAENEVQPVLEEVAGFFDAQGADIKRKELIGRRKLAYAIDGMRHGYYFLIGADMEQSALAEIEKKLKLQNSVVRFLITKNRPKTEEDIKKEKERLARQANISPEPASSDEKPRRRHKRSERQETKPASTPPETKKEEKAQEPKEPVDLDQLEKKLDEILEEEIK